LGDELAIRLSTDDHDFVAHHRRGRRGPWMVEPRQLLPSAVSQRKHPIRLLGGELLPGHEAADYDGLATVRHSREMVQGQR
jgi:hypothetical protein